MVNAKRVDRRFFGTSVDIMITCFKEVALRTVVIVGGGRRYKVFEA